MDFLLWIHATLQDRFPFVNQISTQRAQWTCQFGESHMNLDLWTTCTHNSCPFLTEVLIFCSFLSLQLALEKTKRRRDGEKRRTFFWRKQSLLQNWMWTIMALTTFERHESNKRWTPTHSHTLSWLRRVFWWKLCPEQWKFQKASLSIFLHPVCTYQTLISKRSHLQRKQTPLPMPTPLRKPETTQVSNLPWTQVVSKTPPRKGDYRLPCWETISRQTLQ